MYVFCAKVKLLLTEFICLTFDYLLGVVAVVLAQQINCVVTAWWWKMMSGINIDLTDKRLEYDKWICGVGCLLFFDVKRKLRRFFLRLWKLYRSRDSTAHKRSYGRKFKCRWVISRKVNYVCPLRGGHREIWIPYMWVDDIRCYMTLTYLFYEIVAFKNVGPIRKI